MDAIVISIYDKLVLFRSNGKFKATFQFCLLLSEGMVLGALQISKAIVALRIQ